MDKNRLVVLHKGKIIGKYNEDNALPAGAKVVEIKGVHLDYDLKHFIVQKGEVVDIRGEIEEENPDAKPHVGLNKSGL